MTDLLPGVGIAVDKQSCYPQNTRKAAMEVSVLKKYKQLPRVSILLKKGKRWYQTDTIGIYNIPENTLKTTFSNENRMKF